MASNRQTVVVPGPQLGSQPWWPSVHQMINAAYKRKDVHAFPRDWSRLREDPSAGATGLAEELGPQGELLVIFENDHPIASAGAVPFRGDAWVPSGPGVETDAHVTDGEITQPAPDIVSEDWEVCSFAVHRDRRKEGLSKVLLAELCAFVKAKGAKRLVANYSLEETGNFWPKQVRR